MDSYLSFSVDRFGKVLDRDVPVDHVEDPLPPSAHLEPVLSGNSGSEAFRLVEQSTVTQSSQRSSLTSQLRMGLRTDSLMFFCVELMG